MNSHTMNSHTMAATDMYNKQGFSLPFYLLLLYFVVEYAKPAFMAPLRPALIIQAVLVCFLLSNKDKMTKMLRDKYFKLYLLLLILMIPHVFLATNNYLAFTQFMMMFTYLIIGLSLCVFVDTYPKMNALLMFFIFVMVCCALDRFIGGGKASGSGFLGATGSMGDENDFALAMNVVLPLSIFLGRSEKGFKKWFLWSASILFIVTNVISSSRGGILGLAAVLLLSWLFMNHKFRALIVILLVAAMAWNFAPLEAKVKYSGIGFDSGDKDTGKQRIELWKIGWRAFLDNPIFGVGQGNMPIVIEKYQYIGSGEKYWQRALWGKAIHSLYFTLLPELGLLGVILFVMMLKEMLHKFKVIARLSEKTTLSDEFIKIKNLNIAFLISIVAFLVSGTFLSVLYYPEFWNLSALIVVLYLMVSKTTAVSGCTRVAIPGQ